VDDRELKKLFERIEISIAVQQQVPFANAKRRDQTIDRLPYGVATAANRPIVSRCFPRQVDTAGFDTRSRSPIPSLITRPTAMLGLQGADQFAPRVYALAVCKCPFDLTVYCDVALDVLSGVARCWDNPLRRERLHDAAAARDVR